MKKTPKRNPKPDSSGMRAEYTLDYSRAKPNRFAGRMARDVVAVVLEPDVAAVVSTSAKANAMLRSIISSPLTRKRARARGHRHKAG